MSKPTEQLQIAIQQGPIAPDNEANTFNDWTHLLAFHVRVCKKAGEEFPPSAVLYAKFTNRHETPVIQQITREEAEAMMVAAYRHQMQLQRAIFEFATNEHPE